MREGQGGEGGGWGEFGLWERRGEEMQEKNLTIWSLFTTSFLRKHNDAEKLLLKEVSLKTMFQNECLAINVILSMKSTNLYIQYMNAPLHYRLKAYYNKQL